MAPGDRRAQGNARASRKLELAVKLAVAVRCEDGRVLVNGASKRAGAAVCRGGTNANPFHGLGRTRGITGRHHTLARRGQGRTAGLEVQLYRLPARHRSLLATFARLLLRLLRAPVARHASAGTNTMPTLVFVCHRPLLSTQLHTTPALPKGTVRNREQHGYPRAGPCPRDDRAARLAGWICATNMTPRCAVLASAPVKLRQE